MKKMTRKEEFLNMKVGKLLEYCDNHNCSECKFQEFCLHKSTFTGEEITLISLLSFNVEVSRDDK